MSSADWGTYLAACQSTSNLSLPTIHPSETASPSQSSSVLSILHYHHDLVARNPNSYTLCCPPTFSAHPHHQRGQVSIHRVLDGLVMFRYQTCEEYWALWDQCRELRRIYQREQERGRVVWLWMIYQHRLYRREPRATSRGLITLLCYCGLRMALMILGNCDTYQDDMFDLVERHSSSSVDTASKLTSLW